MCGGDGVCMCKGKGVMRVCEGVVSCECVQDTVTHLSKGFFKNGKVEVQWFGVVVLYVLKTVVERYVYGLHVTHHTLPEYQWHIFNNLIAVYYTLATCISRLTMYKN